MNDLAQSISLYDLDGSLLLQRNLLRKFTYHLIDCHDIRGKNLYCDDEALKAIHARFLSSPRTPITLIGSGNFHYVTYLHLSEMTHPFTLLLIDHHTDLMENKYLLTCGSWVAKSLRTLPFLQKVIIVGPDPFEYEKIPLDLQQHVTILPDNWPLQKLINYIDHEMDETIPLYISIDKDVLDIKFAKTNWDQGHMELPTLLECLTYLLKSTSICGLDICGEWIVSTENSYTPKNQVFIKRNERANFKLIQTTFENYKTVIPNSPNISANVESGNPTTVK